MARQPARAWTWRTVSDQNGEDRPTVPRMFDGRLAFRAGEVSFRDQACFEAARGPGPATRRIQYCDMEPVHTWSEAWAVRRYIEGALMTIWGRAGDPGSGWGDPPYAVGSLRRCARQGCRKYTAVAEAVCGPERRGWRQVAASIHPDHVRFLTFLSKTYGCREGGPPTTEPMPCRTAGGKEHADHYWHPIRKKEGREATMEFVKGIIGRSGYKYPGELVMLVRCETCGGIQGVFDGPAKSRRARVVNVPPSRYMPAPGKGKRAATFGRGA